MRDFSTNFQLLRQFQKSPAIFRRFLCGVEFLLCSCDSVVALNHCDNKSPRSDFGLCMGDGGGSSATKIRVSGNVEHFVHISPDLYIREPRCSRCRAPRPCRRFACTALACCSSRWAAARRAPELCLRDPGLRSSMPLEIEDYFFSRVPRHLAVSDATELPLSAGACWSAGAATEHRHSLCGRYASKRQRQGAHRKDLYCPKLHFLSGEPRLSATAAYPRHAAA